MLEKTGRRITHSLQTVKNHLAELLFLESQANKELIGLTISSYYIKLLKIKLNGSQYKVENFSFAPVPAGTVVKNEIKDPVALANSIRNLFHQSHLTNHNVVFCVSRSMVIMKNISVSNQLTPDEIESKVWIEANRLFPNLVEDIYLDFSVTGPSLQNSTQNDVLVVACRKEFINPFLDTLQLADLNAKIIDINYFAYERALTLITKQSPDLKIIALLNISFEYIDLIVMNEGNAIFTHEMSYDGSSLKQAHQSRVEYKSEMVTEGVNSPVVVEQPKLINTLNAGLGMQIKHIMQFFYSSRPNVRLQRIILSGDCAIEVPELLHYVQAEIGKEVVLANPFKDMIFSSQIDQEKLAHYTPALVLCCGVALRHDGLNLLPWREQARELKKKRFIFESVVAFLFVLFIFILSHFYFSNQAHTKQALIDYLQSQINQQQAMLNNMGSQENEEANIKKQLNMMKNIYVKNNLTIDLLNTLTKLVPANVYITKIDKRNNLVIVSGVATNEDDITRFMQEIGKTPYFKQPVLTAINQEASSGNRFFELTIEQKG